ncbi:MAG: hypothetical protein WCY11_13080 [Novosphingobium sp.]
MGFTAHLPTGSIRAMADSHPGLRALHARLTGELHIEPGRASRLIRSLVTHAVEDLAGSYLGEMGNRLRRIEAIRGQIARAVDHVVADGILPADLDHAGMSRLFDDLQREMEGLRSARTYAEAHPPVPTVGAMVGDITPTAETGVGFRPFEATGNPAQGVAVPLPPGSLGAAMTAMSQSHPARAAVFRQVLAEHGDLLGLAVMAETQTVQANRLTALREALGPGFPPERWNELVGAIEELGNARGRAIRGAGSAADAVRAERLAHLPPQLRAAIGGDRTILGPLAEQFPADLEALWHAWDSGGRTNSFRDYVWSEMASGRRPNLAEWQAAHDLGSQHGVVLLKDPASFDPDSPNLRTVNPREGGTDLLGLREDGEIWYVDDKSHRLTPTDLAAGRTGINLSGVSAFEGRRFIANIRSDVADIEAGIQRGLAVGQPADPRVVDACSRLRSAASAIERESAGWSDADFLEPGNQARIAAILGAPEHRIRLHVTSTMGDVRGMTRRLRGLGISVLPPFVANPASARLP